MSKKSKVELCIMFIVNIIIILSVMFYISSNITYGMENETETYVQYIERSDENENNLKVIELYNVEPDESLLGYTSEDVTVTDSCQYFSQDTDFTYSITEEEKYLLAKITQCEAGNQNIETKELIVSVVLNRVESDKFPNTIEGVIKENRNGVYQFSPLVKGGSWYNTEPTEETYIAVNNVLNGDTEYSNGALYFESCKNENNWHSKNLEFLYKSQSMRFYR